MAKNKDEGEWVDLPLEDENDWQDLALSEEGWEDIPVEPPIEPYGPVQTFGAKALDTAALGYYPQIAGGLSTLTGEDYVTARDEAAKKLALSEEIHPISSMIGTGLGIGASMAIPGAAGMKALQAGTGLARLGRAGVAAGEGLAMAGLQNPGDVPGQVQPLQLEERAAQVEETVTDPTSLAFLLGGSAISGAISRGGKDVVTQASPKEKRALEVLRPSTTQVEDMRTAKVTSPRGQKNLGKFILDNKIAGWGDDFSDIEKKAKAKKEEFGAELGELYQKANEKRSMGLSSKVGAELLSKRQMQFSTPDFYKRIVSSFDESHKGSPDAKTAKEYLAKFLKDEFIDRTSEFVDVPTKGGGVKSVFVGLRKPDLLDLHDYRQKIDGSISDFSKSITDPDQSAKNKALRWVRDIIDDAIETEIKIVEKTSTPGEFKRFKQLNDNFSKATQVADLATRRAARADAGANSFRDLMESLKPFSPGTRRVVGEAARETAIGTAGKIARPISILRSPEVIRRDEQYMEVPPEEKEMRLNEILNADYLTPKQRALKFNSVKKYNLEPIN